MARKTKADTLAHLRSVDALTRYGITLLQKERTVILSGSFDQLAELSEQKTKLLDEIEKRAADVSRDKTTPERQEQRKSLLGVATILSRRAVENQSLLESAINGAKKANEMIQRLNTNNVTGFYSATGQKIASPANQDVEVMKV